MAETIHTDGEYLFEQYLTSVGLSFEFEKKFEDKSKVVDYRVEWKGKSHFFDVKDFESPPLADIGDSAAFQPYKPIRERIARCRKKFKEYKEFCCAPVFFNNGAFVMLEQYDFMVGSMYGDLGFRIPFDPQTGTSDSSKMERAFLGGGMMMPGPDGKPTNTTISALVTLTTIRPEWERLRASIRTNATQEVSELAAAYNDSGYNTDLAVPRVIVWHSAVARMPFPADLFCGPYDTHVGVVKTQHEVTQEVTFRGTLLPPHVNF